MNQFLANIFPNVASRGAEFFDATVQTLIMVAAAGAISFVLALILAVVLITTRRGGLLQNVVVYNILDKVINLFRSIPFIILAAALVPLTRAVVGTAIGTKGALLPLVVGITPFFARQLESALSSTDPGLIEAAEAMGSSRTGIIWHVYLRESIPSILKVTTITIVNLIGLTAIVGIVGGGGLGDFAIRYGYQRYMADATYATIIVLVVIIGLVEFAGKVLEDATDHQ
jgi:D-methionine transport system permease protein